MDENKVDANGDEIQDAKSETQNATVFQCIECDGILGDSTSWVDANPEMKTFTLQYASHNVVVGTSIKTSQGGIDEGSTYKDLRCKKCSTLLGRYYLGTTGDVDKLRRMYTLYANTVNIYEIGSAAQNEDEVLKIDSSDLPYLNLREVTLQISKVQGVTVDVAHRLRRVERVLGLDGSFTGDSDHSSLVDSTDPKTNEKQTAMSPSQKDNSGERRKRELNSESEDRKRIYKKFKR